VTYDDYVDQKVAFLSKSINPFQFWGPKHG